MGMVRDEITEVYSKISSSTKRSRSSDGGDSPVRKERKVKPIYNISSDDSDDDDYVPDEIPDIVEEFDNDGGILSSSDESRSSSRSSDHPGSNVADYKLKPCHIF